MIDPIVLRWFAWLAFNCLAVVVVIRAGNKKRRPPLREPAAEVGLRRGVRLQCYVIGVTLANYGSWHRVPPQHLF